MQSRHPRTAISLLFVLIAAYMSVLADDLEIKAELAENQHIDYLGQAPPGITPEKFAPDIISLEGAIHGSIAFYPDGLEIYWTLCLPSFPKTVPMVMYVKKIENTWTAPSMTLFSDENGAAEISISPSRDRLYFASRRPLPRDWEYQLEPGTREWGVGKVWFVEREGNNWGEPHILDRHVNEDLNGVSATKGGTLYSSGIRRIRKTADGWGAVEWLRPPLDIIRPAGNSWAGIPMSLPMKVSFYSTIAGRVTVVMAFL